MATYTPILKLTDFAYGDTTGNGYLNYGDMVDGNFLIVENALGEVVNLSVAATNVTLTEAQEQSLVIQLTGILTANINIVTSGRKGFWFFSNLTTGTFTITVKTASGSGVGLAKTGKSILYSDGTNIISVMNLSLAGQQIIDDSSTTAMRTTLSLTPGTDVMAYDATLAAIAALTIAADQVPYSTGVDTFSMTSLTSFGRSLIDDADASTALSTLGVSTFIKTILDDADAATLRTTIGLGNLDNTSDANKPVSTAQNTAIATAGSTSSPAGKTAFFAQNSAPTGWLKANGAAISRTTYAALFTAIGTTHGAGDGSTTFNVPDLRGEFIRGWDDARGIDASRVFGSSQLDAFQGHYHSSNSFAGASASLGAVGGANVYSGVGLVTAPITDGTNGTPRTAAETRPRNIALLACIKF